jgi:hypothetical protein
MKLKAFLFSLVVMVGWVNAQLNAHFVSIECPDTVVATDVFDCSITMQNNGTLDWLPQGDQAHQASLNSQSTRHNVVWGAYYKVIGQGSSVVVGGSYVFNPKLRAPATPGTYTMSWQMQNWSADWDTTHSYFGDTATKEMVVIAKNPAAQPFNFTYSTNVLDSSSLEYVGSVRVPDLGGQEAKYIEGGICIRDVGGSKTFLISRATEQGPGELHEVTMPEFIIPSSSSFSNCNTVSQIRTYGVVTSGTTSGVAQVTNSGIWFDPIASLLYWTTYQYYYNGGASDYRMLSVAHLGTDNVVTPIKGWRFPSTTSQFKGYWYGVQQTPKHLVDNYNAGGITLGWGGTFNVTAVASRGPAIAFSDKYAYSDSSDDTANLQRSINYGQDTGCIRDGNYLTGFSWWNNDPIDIYRGWWSAKDFIRAGVMVDLPDKKGCLVFTGQQFGWTAYCYGGGTIDPHSDYNWYFYNLDTIGECLLGNQRYDRASPSSISREYIPYRQSNVFEYVTTGACFDSSTRTIYTYRMRTQSNGYPAINAYRVLEGSIPSDTPLVDNAAYKLDYLQDIGSGVMGYPCTTGTLGGNPVTVFFERQNIGGGQFTPIDTISGIGNFIPTSSGNYRSYPRSSK